MSSAASSGSALVTGAGGSLGRAIALRLAADGRTVAAADLDLTAAESTAALVRAAGGAAQARAVDLREADEIAALFAWAQSEFGPVDVLVNNAAVYPPAAFVDVSVDQYDDVQAVNQRGYWLCAQHAARSMTARGAGAIVNVASITMHGGWADLAAYVTTKAAASGLTRALARELGPAGVRVNAVSPGAFPTAAEQIYDDPTAYNQHVLDQQSLKRRGTPAELAAVVAFLAGPDASFVTGQTIEVNGGWVMT